jgi:hypothetical protein
MAQIPVIGAPPDVCEPRISWKTLTRRSGDHRGSFKHAMDKGAAKADLTAILKYVKRDAGFEMPKTR